MTLRWRRLVIAALVLGGAALVYAFAFKKPHTLYDRRVDELLKEWEKHADDERRMRVEGALVPGSLVQLQRCEYRFRLKANGKEIPVRFPSEPAGGRCPVLPDTFLCEAREGNTRVTVQGYPEGTAERPGFVAESVMSRVPRFDLGEQLPRCPPVPRAR